MCLVVSVADPLTSGNMDKETEWIMEGDMSSMEDKSDSPDEETSKEELTPKGTTITYVCMCKDIHAQAVYSTYVISVLWDEVIYTIMCVHILYCTLT